MQPIIAALPPRAAWGGLIGFRNARGTLAGIAGAWFGVPFILLMSSVGAIVGGLAGTVSGTFVAAGVLDRLNTFLTWIFPLPVKAEELLSSTAAQIGGIIGGILGAANGAWELGWRAAVWPWQLLYAGDPMWPWAVAVGQILTALVVGWLYTGFWAIAERAAWRLKGARRMSRREADWLLPIMNEVTGRMGIKSPPELMIADGHTPNAYAGIRHICIQRGLLTLLEHDREMLAGVMAHELAHWRNGDALSSTFSRGVALPLYLLHELAYRMVRRAPWRPLQWMFRALLWSVTATVRYLVRPMHRKSVREREFAADRAAMMAGYGRGLRRVLLSFQAFEHARDGWDEVMFVTHPPTELRLERLEEDDDKRYPLTEDPHQIIARYGIPGSSVRRSHS